MENKGGVTIPRWAFGLAAAVVALLVVLVIVLIPRGGDNSNTSASGGSNGAAQSKSTSTVEAGNLRRWRLRRPGGTGRSPQGH